MNPNSGNQLWSKWTVTVTPGRIRPAGLQSITILPAVAKKFRSVFGSASQMRILTQGPAVTFEVMTEGTPAHDPGQVASVETDLKGFFERGFGPGTSTVVKAKVLAGSTQDGRPAEQLLIIPPLTLQE